MHRTEKVTLMTAWCSERAAADSLAMPWKLSRNMKLSSLTPSPIHEIGTDDGRDFIAMEYVEGRTLREAVATGMPLRDLVSTCLEAARALAAAHDAGILHRT